MPILITGHEGLVGRHLWKALQAGGRNLVGLDLVATEELFRGDIQDSRRLSEALSGVSGVVHLAAVSRVIWAEQEPEKCWATNVLASRNLLELAIDSPNRPWVLAVSSREVYGEAQVFPVAETTQLRPVNIYGEAKLQMEIAAHQARNRGLNTAIVRLANVYGCPLDHHDRVLPAFCRAAANGGTLRVDGMNHLFDFTHISDVVSGLLRLVALLDHGVTNLPSVHLLPGVATTLGAAARMAVAAAGTGARIVQGDSRKYDVSRFVGCPRRAQELLNWKASILPEAGIHMFVKMLQNALIQEGVNENH